ncbi:hypothetical protein D3C85_834790 [compost metagenome]
MRFGTDLAQGPEGVAHEAWQGLGQGVGRNGGIETGIGRQPRCQLCHQAQQVAFQVLSQLGRCSGEQLVFQKQTAIGQRLRQPFAGAQLLRVGQACQQLLDGGAHLRGLGAGGQVLQGLEQTFQ